MRGNIDRQKRLFHTFDLDDLGDPAHPLRPIKSQVDEELRRLQPKFRKAYSDKGRRSIPPEHLIKALLLQALYSIRSERHLCEQIAYNMLFRWFLDLQPDARVQVIVVPKRWKRRI